MALDYGSRIVNFVAGVGDIHKRLFVASAGTPATGGTWTITVNGQTTSGIAHDAAPAAVVSALEALSTVGVGDVTAAMLSGANLGVAFAIMEVRFVGALDDTNPTVTTNMGGLTGNPHVGVTRLYQRIAIASGPGSDRTIKLARFTISGATALNTRTDHARLGAGVCDASRQYAGAAIGENGASAATADTGRTVDNASCILITPTSAQGLHANAERRELGVGFVDIGWINEPTEAWRCSARLFFGNDLEAYAFSIAGNGTQNSTASFNPGFANSPRLGELWSFDQAMGASQSADEAMISVGWFGLAGSTITQGATVVCAEDREANTSSGVHSVNGYAARRLTSAAKTVTAGAALEVTTMSASSVVFTTREASEVVNAFGWVVAVPGVRGFATAETIAAGSTGVKSLNSIGFKPRVFSIASQRTGTVGAVGNGQGNLCVGGSDGSVQMVQSWSFRDNQAGSSDAECLFSDAHVVSVIDMSSPLDWVAEFDAFNSAGVDVEVTTAAGGTRVVSYGVLEELIREDPTPVGLSLVLPAPAILVLVDPDAVAAPLVLPAPTLLVAETPAAVPLALVLPAPTLLVDLDPDPVALALALPAPALLATLTPTPVDLALVLPAPALLVLVDPDPVELPLVLPAPTLLVAETPAAVPLPLALPAPTVLEAGEQGPDPVALALALPAPALLATLTPTPVDLALVLPAPALLVLVDPDPAELALVLPAPALFASETPATVALALVLPASTVVLAEQEEPEAVELLLALPAPARLLELLPAPVELELAAPPPQVLGVLTPAAVELAMVVPDPFLGRRLGIELVAEVARALQAPARVARSAEVRIPTPRSLELVTALE